MKPTKSRSAVWSIINWSTIREQVYEQLAIHPDKVSIENAITIIEAEHTENDLFLMEADQLELLLVDEISQVLHQDKKKEIKKRQSIRERMKKQKEREQKEREQMQSNIQILGMDDLKDMDPEMMEELSKGILDQLMGKKKKDKKDDDDDEEANSSFYL